MLTIILASAFVAMLVVSALVGFDAPPDRPASSGDGIDFASAIAGDYEDLPPLRSYPARDGTALPYRLYGSSGPGARRLVILVHGSGWHGMQFHAMARAIATRGIGTVTVPDLRGHGASPQRRGDVDYIGQFEDDLADLIGSLNAGAVFDEIVLGGHSSGGGLVVRFAGGVHGDLADRFVLMAPFLKYNAPTTRLNSGGWAAPATGRIIALSILNGLGITAFNHLPVISFAMPREVMDGPLGDTATTSYSFRLNQSFAPRSDFEADLRAITRPMLLIAGTSDEAFYAERYEDVISPQTKSGTYILLPGVDHIGVTNGDAAIDAVARWIGRETR